METNIDTLTIKIGASSDRASKEVKALTDNLRALRNVVNGKWKNPVAEMGNTKAAKTGSNLASVRDKVKLRIDASDADKAQKKVGLLAKTLNSLKRIAFYRLIRTAIKDIGKAFEEGSQNAYWFSKTVGENTAYIAEAFDNLASKSFKMDNQLGASFATLKAAIVPILVEIINWITKAADALTQFFALMSGKSYYLKAVDYTKEAYENTKKGAGAAKEWKNQLMGFDEINRLEEPSSGGGGGGSALPDYANMFEETKLSEWTEKVKATIDWIREHLKLIRDLAIGVGAALLAWKVINFASSLTKIPLPLKTILGYAIAIGGATIYVQGFVDAWNNGVNWDNLAEMIGGVTLAAIGLGMALGSTAAAVALLIGGFGMLVVGIRDWIKKGELTAQSFWLIEAGIVAVSVALGILIGWPAALVGAFVAALGVIIYYWDEIIGRVKAAIQAIREFFSIKQINARVDAATADGSIYLQGFASGGYPENGQLFLAREAGPELVGTVGNRTAVANNSDILNGIREGVFEAVTAAMGGGGNDKAVYIYLDGREIASTTTRYQRQFAHANG